MDNVPLARTPDSTKYLYSDGRGTIFHWYSKKAPAEKRNLFTWVEAWLRSRNILP